MLIRQELNPETCKLDGKQINQLQKEIVQIAAIVSYCGWGSELGPLLCPKKAGT